MAGEEPPVSTWAEGAAGARSPDHLAVRWAQEGRQSPASQNAILIFSPFQAQRTKFADSGSPTQKVTSGPPVVSACGQQGPRTQSW